LNQKIIIIIIFLFVHGLSILGVKRHNIYTFFVYLMYILCKFFDLKKDIQEMWKYYFSNVRRKFIMITRFSSVYLVCHVEEFFFLSNLLPSPIHIYGMKIEISSFNIYIYIYIYIWVMLWPSFHFLFIISNWWGS
jgi:hypothetical protein